MMGAMMGYAVRKWVRMAAFAFPFMVLAGAPALAQKQMTPTGVWESPGGNTRLRIQPCGKEICGKVAWASPKAKADAARGGHPKLVGMQLFGSFTRTGPATFEGRVFVPDINRSFNGRMTMTGPKAIEVRGCLAGRMGCRTQVWTWNSG